MRMSIRKSDRGYNKRSFLFIPYLDGIKIDHCFTADEDMGYILVHKTDSKGKVLLNENRTEILVDKLFGKVEIKRSALDKL